MFCKKCLFYPPVLSCDDGNNNKIQAGTSSSLSSSSLRKRMDQFFNGFAAGQLLTAVAAAAT